MVVQLPKVGENVSEFLPGLKGRVFAQDYRLENYNDSTGGVCYVRDLPTAFGQVIIDTVGITYAAAGAPRKLKPSFYPWASTETFPLSYWTTTYAIDQKIYTNLGIPIHPNARTGTYFFIVGDDDVAATDDLYVRVAGRILQVVK